MLSTHVLDVQTFFASKNALEKGTAITMLWTPAGSLELLVREDDSALDYSTVTSLPSCMHPKDDGFANAY